MEVTQLWRAVAPQVACQGLQLDANGDGQDPGASLVPYRGAGSIQLGWGVTRGCFSAQSHKYKCRAITWEEQCLVEAPDRWSLQHYGSLSTQNGSPHYLTTIPRHHHQSGTTSLPPLASLQLPPGASGHEGQVSDLRTPLPAPSAPLGARGAPRDGCACGPPNASHNTLLEDGEQQTPGCPLLAPH